ncbi:MULTISPECIES: DUF4314 domain-containing protein [Gracilibacillus]|nr:DUF4314 domain-containing protein [Gracilibacillus thailandensis]
MVKTRKIPVNKIKKDFPKGLQIRILAVNCPFISIPVGTIGKVQLVDDNGRLYVLLESDRIITLNVNEDIIQKGR